MISYLILKPYFTKVNSLYEFAEIIINAFPAVPTILYTIKM